MHQQRQRREDALLSVAVVAVLQRADHALHDRVDGLEVRGVGQQLDVDVAPRAGLVGAVEPEVVLDVAGALDGLGVDVTLELAEDLGVVLADDVRQDVEPAAVGHAHHDVLDVVVCGRLAHRVEQRDERLGALEPEALLSGVLGVEEGLEGLRGVEALQDPGLVLGGDVEVLALDLLADPGLLLRVEHVAVLEADGAAVGVTQRGEDVAELLRADVAADVGAELAVVVPQRQAVVGGVELRVHLRLLLPQRVEVGDQVTSDAVHVGQLTDLHLLGEQVGLGVERGGVGPPAGRLVGQPQRGEHRVEEALLAEQELVDAVEEHPRLRTLDDAVVVGRGQRDDLADAQLGQRARVGGRVLGGVGDGPDAEDGGLTGHQPRDGVDRADGAGVGQRDRPAGEHRRLELLGPDLADDLLVGEEELLEGHPLGVLDHRHQQRA